MLMLLSGRNHDLSIGLILITCGSSTELDRLSVVVVSCEVVVGCPCFAPLVHQRCQVLLRLLTVTVGVIPHHQSTPSGLLLDCVLSSSRDHQCVVNNVLCDSDHRDSVLELLNMWVHPHTSLVVVVYLVMAFTIRCKKVPVLELGDALRSACTVSIGASLCWGLMASIL